MQPTAMNQLLDCLISNYKHKECVSMRESWREQAIAQLLSEYHVKEDEQVSALLYQYVKVAMKLHLDGQEDYS